MEPITVLIVDDHRLIRDSWSVLLGSDSRFEVVAAASTSEEALEIATIKTPAIILMDLNMIPVDGFETTRLMSQASPLSRIIAVTMHAMPVYAKKMFKAGASGYVTKNSSGEELINAILQVNNGKKYICAEVTEIISRKVLNPELSLTPDINDLTQREIEVAKLLKEGLTSKQMALRLDISPKTIEVQRASLLKKLHMKNTAALVDFIHSNDL